MQVGLVSSGMAARPLSEVVQRAAQWGCEVIELSARPGVHRDLWSDPVNLRAIAGEVAEYGLSIASIAAAIDLAEVADESLAAQVEQMVRVCEVARTLEVPVVRTAGIAPARGQTPAQTYGRMVALLKAVVARIADWGVAIGVENQGPLLADEETLTRLLNDVDSPVVGLTLDTASFCRNGCTIAAAHQYLDRLAPLAVNVHMKDGQFRDGEWVALPAGRGDLDLVGIMASLGAAGYEGALLSEYEGAADYGISTLESVAYVRGLRDATERAM